MRTPRRDDEPPEAVARLGWRYHHVGIPHTDPRPGELHLAHLGVHVYGFETSPCGIEWMRFDPDSPVPGLVKTVPHVAFAVDDLDAALEGQEILIAPTSPSDGVRVAFVVQDGAPVELLEFYGSGSGRRAREERQQSEEERSDGRSGCGPETEGRS